MARHLDGSNDMIETTTRPSDATDNITMGICVNYQSTATDEDVLIYNGDSGANGYGLFFDRPDATMKLLLGGGGGVNGSVAVNTGQWDSWIIRRSSGTWTIWRNGSSNAAGSTAPNTPATLGFRIGDQLQRAAFNLEKYVAEAFFYDVALTDAEIVALASIGNANATCAISPTRVRPESLKLYWPLWGRHSPEIDLISGNNGTVTEAVYVDHPPVHYGGFGQALVSGGGGADTVSPAAVSAAWSVVTPAVKKGVNPAAVSAAWSAVTPTIQHRVNPAAASAAWSVVTPAIDVTISVDPVSAAWSVVVPTTQSQVNPSPVSAAWSAVVPAIQHRVNVSPVVLTWTPNVITQFVPALVEDFYTTLRFDWTIYVPDKWKIEQYQKNIVTRFASQHMHGGIQEFTTSEEVIASGDIVTGNFGMLWLWNLDDTNDLIWGPESGGSMVNLGRVYPDRLALITVHEDAVMRAKSSASTVRAMHLFFPKET